MEIHQLELVCKEMYESTDHARRAEAEKALVAFQDSPDALTQCQLLLDRADSSYSQLLAATTLTKLVSRNIQGLSLMQRIDIRNYVLTYFLNRPNLQNFVIQALVTLLAKITKYSWFDLYKNELVFRNIVEDVRSFLQGSVEHCMIGVQILSQLTSEMNPMVEVDANLTFTKHRKIACSFRDTQLYDIFLLSCSLLGSARENNKNLNFMDDAQNGLMTQVLRLAKNCLSFDFIGTSTDESTDELSTIQIPTSWRPVFLDLNTLNLFFDLYDILPNSLSSLALACLVQITSVRRSLFSNAERAKFLSALVRGVKNILENSKGFSDPENYHEFCRLLARLKSNYQLGELVTVDCYPEAIQLIAKFTIQSLQMWQFAPNSVHYLLSLWQKMVASVPFVKSTEPHLLGTYTPEITKAYITSRLESVAVIVRTGQEDLLDDQGMVQQQLEQLSVIERCEYEKTCALLVQLFDQTANAYQQLLSVPEPNKIDVTIQEGQLTWLVYIIGSVIGARVSFSVNDEHDVMDGELIFRVLQLMNLTDSRLPQAGCVKLELAIMSFLEQVRKTYISEQMHKVYKRLSEVLGLNDEPMLLSVINRKIIKNLKYWGESEQIIRKTLNLLNDLSSSYSCVRKLVKLDEIQFMLNNHTSEHFQFLGTNCDVSEMRMRSMFYSSLGRLLMVDFGDDEERFYTFMLPMTNQFESIGAMLMDVNNGYPSDEAKKALIGLSRDLRGLACVLGTKAAYMMFFEWIYPDYTPILIRAIELWGHDPTVTTPILKLFAEFVHNRSQRLHFDVSSPNGVLLFREASKVICTYGSRVLTLEVHKNQEYQMRLKGMSVCFLMLKSILCGNYVNFGIFKLYGDDTLDNVLNTTVEMILSIPHNHLLEYPKLSQSYYVLLECLAQDHITFLATLEPRVFLYILESIADGLKALGSMKFPSNFTDTMVCTGCCSTLDHIVSYIFKQLANKVSTFPGKKIRREVAAQNDTFLKVMELHPEILQNILSILLNIIIFEDCRNQFSMSRPLLGLILLYEEYFRQLKANIIQNQPIDRQQTMAQWFDNLMDGIERNLHTKNRDRFTQNLSLFRRDINDLLKSSNFAGIASNSDMVVS
ncbi:ran-binding protein 16 isoform X1 [Phlebotomus argentipes]|uniref:ran-binding protein 16 isoform X1 n=1 Tax=Phlebotomus argentipes TaxID=94469 RepID=UPI00289337E5|nr:ran-binding protein 16 isoform X1 [Phlebotomus argentipes]